MVHYALAGLVLVSFIIWHKYLHGKVFFTLNFAIDTIFEVMYCIFPLLFLTSNSGDGKTINKIDLVSLGTLGEQNGFIIIQSLFAIILLVRKCRLLLQDLEPTHIAKSHWRKMKKLKMKTNKFIPWIKSKKQTRKLKKQGFINMNELYRLAVARFETPQTIKPRRELTLSPTSQRKPTKQSASSPSFFDNANDIDPDREKTLTTQQVATATDQIQLTAMENDDNNLQIVKRNSVDLENSATNTRDNTPADDIPFGQESKDVAAKEFGTNSVVNINDINNHDGDTATEDHLHRDSKTKKQHWREQFQRKSIILCCGLMFIGVGLLILIKFVSFIENDYKNKCLNYDISNQFHIDHPELKFYNLYCNKKVVNMFSDYPCNCRQLSALDINTTQFSPAIVKASLEHFDSLEGYFITQDASPTELTRSNVNYTYTKSMLAHLVCN